MSPRQILFLQGLPGDFFQDCASALLAAGHGVHRINFNGGDLADWRLPGAVNYHGPARRWAGFLARLIKTRGITDMVLFGDCRPLHRTARATAAGLGVVVHVFEEGYIRPDWITMEVGGVNGFSPLPNDPQWYRDTAKSLAPVPTHTALPEAFAGRARATIRYYIAALLLVWAFPFYRTHRPWNPLMEAAGWCWRLAQRQRRAHRTPGLPETMAPTNYFVFPLQLNSDYQLRAHSDFDGMQPALAEVIASFARRAPPGAVLVVKGHPLDNGLSNWRQRTMDYARAVGAGDRVCFFEMGDINPLVRHARGVVTINSTTGTLALAAGVPVIALGRAIYDISGLTHRGSLDVFWTHPERPDVDLYEAFCRVLVSHCLLHGGFYDTATRKPLVNAAVLRLEAAPRRPVVSRTRLRMVDPSLVFAE
jgi:capsular polysaccharide export protein